LNLSFNSIYPVLEALSEAALLTDADLNLVAINSAAEALYEVRSSVMKGRKLIELIGSLISEGGSSGGWAAVLSGEAWRDVVWHQKPNRKRFRAEVSVRAVFDEHNALEGLIAIVKDVTEREVNLVRQTMLSRCLRAIGDTETPESLFDAVLEQLTGDGGADAAVFRLRESRGYRLLATAGVAARDLEAVRIANFDDEEPALTRGEVIRVALSNETKHPKYNVIAGLGFAEVYLVGQRVAGELLGSVGLIYRESPWVDLSPILPEVAAALGSRLERERSRARLERERQAMELLAKVSTAMRDAEDDVGLFRIATDYALTATKATTSMVLLANEARDRLHPVSASGANRDRIMAVVVTRERGLSWQVLDTGRPRVEDISTKQDEVMTLDPILRGWYVGVPIRLDDRVIGVLTADTHTSAGDSLSVTDMDTMTTIAETLSSAIARLRALESAERRAEALAQLAQLSADLEQLEEPRNIAERASSTLLQLIGLEAVIYFDYKDDYLEPLTILGNVPKSLTSSTSRVKVESMQGVFGRALTEEGVQVIRDYQEDPTALEIFKTFGFRTSLLAPIRLNGQVRAFLSAASFTQTTTLPPNTREVLEFLTGRLARALERVDAVQEVMNTRAATFRTLGKALELRDFETKGHTDRVVELSLRLGHYLRLNTQQMQALEWGALLHDIGKIAVPDRVLLKPGKLDDSEWLWIRQHPGIGYQMLLDLDFLPKETLEIVLYHQERSDGSGYPEGRNFENTPYLAQLFAVIDVFDALTSERPYKPAWSTEAAIRELRAQAGKTLHADLVEAFIRVLEASPSRNIN
jgi:HD-GYP domain-containing protein (c-di-GMP phosphodiesterase class II)